MGRDQHGGSPVPGLSMLSPGHPWLGEEKVPPWLRKPPYTKNRGQLVLSNVWTQKKTQPPSLRLFKYWWVWWVSIPQGSWRPVWCLYDALMAQAAISIWQRPNALSGFPKFIGEPCFDWQAPVGDLLQLTQTVVFRRLAGNMHLYIITYVHLKYQLSKDAGIL